MEYDLQLIVKRLQAARKAKHYTQDYVSAKAEIGEKILSQIECGKAGLSVKTLLVLCDILEVTPTYVLLADPSLAAQTPVTELLRGLTPQQLSDAEQLLEIFVRNCRAEKSRTYALDTQRKGKNACRADCQSARFLI